MGMRMTGFDSLQAMFRTVERDATRAAATALHTEGEAIKERSQALAPIDEGNLEQAHAVDTEREPGKVTTTVSVGGTVNGVEVDAYTLFTHEADYNLGPKSAEKAQRTGEPVGRKYLERSFREREPHIVENIADAVRKALE